MNERTVYKPELPRFKVIERMGKIVHAGGKLQAVEKRPGVAQLVAELLGFQVGPEVELAQRIHGDRRLPVKVAEGVALGVAPGEDVGNRAIAERHVPIHPGVEKMRLGVEIAIFVHIKLMAPAVVVIDILGGRPVGFDALVFVTQRQIKIRAGSPTQDRTQHQRILSPEGFAVALIFEPALILVGIHGEARRQRIGQRGVEGGRIVEIGRFAPALDRTAERGFKLLGRGPGIEQHRAADHVAPEQHALRAAQDLDALQVEGVEQQQRIRAHIDAIHEHAHGRVQGGNGTVDAHAANREIYCPARGADLIKAHVGDANSQVAQGTHLGGCQLLGVKGRHRHRHVLDRLLAFLGGDNDIGQQRGAFRSGGRFRCRLSRRRDILGRARQRTKDDAQHHQQQAGEIDNAHDSLRSLKRR